MTVRDSITRTRARTPRVEDDPTSATMRDRALGPTQCGISDVATKCTKGGRKPNICRCMLGAVLSWRCLGRHRLRCQPCSRIGENPPYGMIGGIEETSASSKPDPRLDPTRLDEVALIRDTISHYAPVLIALCQFQIRRACLQKKLVSKRTRAAIMRQRRSCDPCIRPRCVETNECGKSTLDGKRCSRSVRGST